MAVTKKYYLDSEGLKHLIQRIVAEDKRRDIIAANGIELAGQGNPAGTTGQSIGVKIKSGDQILTKDSNGLAAAVKLVEYTETEISNSTWNDKENVLKAYKLVGADGTTVLTGSEPIKIYKDRSLASVHVGNPANNEHKESLYFVYNLASGATQTVEVDMSQFALDYTAGDGIAISSEGVVSVNADTSKGLGFGTATAGGTKPLQVKVAASGLHLVDGESNWYDVASASFANFLHFNANGELVVDAEWIQQGVLEEIGKLDFTDNGAAVSGATDMYVSKVNEVDGKISIGGRQYVDLAHLVNYVQKANATTTDVKTTDTISEAIKKLENQISAVQRDAGAAHSVVALTGTTSGTTTTSAHLTLTVTTDSNTGAKTFTFAENNIADADDLTAEIAARKAVTGINADTYSAPSGTNYLGSTTSLTNADIALDTAVKAVDDKVNTNQVVANDVIGIQGTPDSTNGTKLVVNVDNATIGKSNNALKTLIQLKKLGAATNGYAASYVLADVNGNTLSGDVINITKDQFLTDVKYMGAADPKHYPNDNTTGISFPALRFEWAFATDGDGESPDKSKGVTYVSIADIGSAATTTLNTHSGTGENHKYIVVTDDPAANGAHVYDVDTQGIDNAIAAAVNALDATVRGNMDSSDNVDSNKHVGVKIVETDGKLTGVTVKEQDIASAAALTAEETRAKAAEAAIDTAVGLTKAANSETRTWTPTTNYGGSTTNAQANMQAIDTQVKANADAITDLQAAIESIHDNYIDDVWSLYISGTPIAHNPDGTHVSST